MPDLLTCPHGHRWDSSASRTAVDGSADPLPPLCEAAREVRDQTMPPPAQPEDDATMRTTDPDATVSPDDPVLAATMRKADPDATVAPPDSASVPDGTEVLDPADDGTAMFPCRTNDPAHAPVTQGPGRLPTAPVRKGPPSLSAPPGAPTVPGYPSCARAGPRAAAWVSSIRPDRSASTEWSPSK